MQYKQDLRNSHKTRMVRDTENIITAFTISRSVTATAIMPEVNLHRILLPLQDNYQSPIPNFQISITNI